MWEQTKCPSMDGWMDKRRSIHSTWASQVGPVVKNPPADTEDVGEAASIPGWGRRPGGGHGTRSHALRIPWTEEAVGLESQSHSQAGLN